MRLFKRKIPPPALLPLPASGALIKCKEWLRKQAGLVAQRLSRWESHMSISSKIVAISSFCLLMGIFSMTLLYRGLYSHSQGQGIFSDRPAIIQPGSPQLSDATLDSIRRVRIARDSTRSKTHDSITK